MKKLLLLLSIWITSLSFASASVESDIPTLFNKSKVLTGDQDAPIYPNPARDYIFLRLTNVNFSDNSDLAIEIRNILGNKMPVQLERTGGDTYRISLADYPSGYYLLVLQCDGCGSKKSRYEEIHKFLKQ